LRDLTSLVSVKALEHTSEIEVIAFPSYIYVVT